MKVKKKILVVDDDLDLLEQITAILTAAGYDVTAAEGQAGCEEAILKVKPDLAILDLMMEEKDSGFVLSHQLKKLYPEMPVILLTAVAGATGLSFAARHSDEQSWNMDPDLLAEELAECARRGKLPKAVIPTDLYGQCCDLPRITDLCARYEVPVVCDSAEAMGAFYQPTSPAVSSQWSSQRSAPRRPRRPRRRLLLQRQQNPQHIRRRHARQRRPALDRTCSQTLAAGP